MRRLPALLLLSLLAAAPAQALSPSEILPDAQMEARARALSAQLRCLVCQNQSIDDSDASLARDLRQIVRERLKAGDSDAKVLDYLVARYGDFVLLNPPLRAHTFLLWGAPALAFALGALAIALASRRPQPQGGGAPLDPAEEARLAAMLERDP